MCASTIVCLGVIVAFYMGYYFCQMFVCIGDLYFLHEKLYRTVFWKPDRLQTSSHVANKSKCQISESKKTGKGNGAVKRPISYNMLLPRPVKFQSD